jgi:hypothetical protein
MMPRCHHTGVLPPIPISADIDALVVIRALTHVPACAGNLTEADASNAMNP